MVGQATFSDLEGVGRRCAAKKKDEFLSAPQPVYALFRHAVAAERAFL